MTELEWLRQMMDEDPSQPVPRDPVRLVRCILAVLDAANAVDEEAERGLYEHRDRYHVDEETMNPMCVALDGLRSAINAERKPPLAGATDEEIDAAEHAADVRENPDADYHPDNWPDR